MEKHVLFLDRDGVINDLVGFSQDRGPRVPSELNIRNEVIEFVKKAHNLGFQIIVVTNQPDVSRGLMTVSDNEYIRSEILEQLPPGSSYYQCLHDNISSCICRKPKPGLIHLALADNYASKDNCYFVGDKWTDILAAKNAGITSILLLNENSFAPTSQGEHPSDLHPDYVINNINELLPIISGSVFQH